ncbi:MULTISPECIES: beta-N-acetylhexosaminidase [Chitinophagaceae]
MIKLRTRDLALIALLMIGSVQGYTQQSSSVKILPIPVSVQQRPGTYIVSNKLTVHFPQSNNLNFIKQQLRERIQKNTGLQVVDTKSNAALTFKLNTANDQAIGKEGYKLDVDAKGITISANDAAGLFYGMQSFVQLMPVSSTQTIKIPYVQVTDYPRFAWRGLMLDVARHFFTKEEVKSYIDQMAKYKFNLFHWHLTDDEGWRLQIKSLPKLTEVGAWKVYKVGYFGTFSPVSDTDKYNYGGFYTQEDVKEIVQYAKDRFVDILPEIDVPGHSMAAVASYPELSCTPGADKYHVRSGEDGFMDWTDSGMVAHYDNTLCPTNPKVYSFLDKVFTEVAALFPFPYIHIGGDECAKTFWKKNPDITALMQKEGMKSYEEVQSYFEKKVEKIVESKNKKVIGWDEILEGGLAPNAAVMSWRGEKGGIEATQLKHDVIMSPTTYAYLDYMQGDRAMEPRVYASLLLKKAYDFDAVPAGADAKYIKGGQANLWSEQLYTMRYAEYMTWPRALAISESLWSPKQKKNWNSFVDRVEAQFPYFDKDSVKYAPSMYEGKISVKYGKDSLIEVTLSKELDNVDLYYSVDNSFPDNFYPKYTAPFLMPKDAAMLRIISYKDGKPVGRLITAPIADLKKRTKHSE